MALQVCKSRGLTEAHVYVLGRMGAHFEALALMLDVLADMKGAVECVRASRDADLWQALLTHSMAKPELVQVGAASRLACANLSTHDTLT